VTSRHLLMALSVAFGAMGLFFVLSPSVTLSFFDWMVYGGTDASPVPASLMAGETRRYAGFIYQVLGAIIFGWAVLLALVIRGPQLDGVADTDRARRVDDWTWYAFALSFAAWFVLDTAMSLVMGFWQNAVFNCLFGIAIAIPLIVGWPRRHNRPG